MPDIIEGPPEAGTYRYVLARWDWPLNQTYRVANYSETKGTRVVKWPRGWALPDGRGNPNAPTQEDRRVVMAFVQDRHLRDRLVRFQGWTEITKRWFRHLNHPDDGPTPGLEIDDEIPGETIARVKM